MRDLTSRLRTVFTELKRRRVFRVFVVYAVFGFAALEGTSNLAAALHFPPWTVTLVAVLVLIGLPVSLFLGWVFDLTPAGVVRTGPRVGTAALSDEAVPAEAVAAATDVAAADAVQAEAIRAEALPDGTVAAAGSSGASPPEPRVSRKAIAVLPFVDMSPEGDQEYFGDGLAEEIINALTMIEDLHVVARTSSFAFRGGEQSAHAIGEKLHVGTLLEGSVRKAGNRVRITAQLVDVADGYHLWSERFDRELEDVFEIQDEVARAIVATLKVKLVGDRDAPIIRPGTENLEAYTLYLKGRYHWNRRTVTELEKGIELFKQAIAIDPRYAPAWAGLADSYSILGWYRHLPALEAYSKTVSAASSAVAVDDSLAEAYTSLAYARFLYGWDWTGAERGFLSAIERNPEYSVARHWYGEFLMAMGRFDEAREQVTYARELDPLSLVIGFGEGWVHYFVGRYDEAIAQYRRTLERDSDLVLAPWFLGPAYIAAGEVERAIAVYEEWLPRVHRKAGLTALLAHALAVSGRRSEALKRVAQLEGKAESEPVPPDYLALVYTGLGEVDRAFEWLDRALAERVWYLVYLKVDPAFAPLRSDPRFDALLSEIGLDRTPAPRPTA